MVENLKKRGWLILVFSLVTVLATLLVAWLSYSTFEKNYIDIRRQYSSVINNQTVSEIETSIKNGKQLHKYYGMAKILNRLVSMYQMPAEVVVTNTVGKTMYSSFDNKESKGFYESLLSALDVSAYQDNMVFNQNEYEFMLQPIFEEGDHHVGNLITIYAAQDLAKDMAQSKAYIFKWTFYITAAIILLIFLVLLIGKEKTEEDREGNKKKSHLAAMIPTFIIIIGIGVQSGLTYKTIYNEYKQAMFEGASHISDYIWDIISGIHEKGAPYDQMYGLEDFFAEKTTEAPILWNVKMSQILADTKNVLERKSEYSISKALDEDASIYIDIEISKPYIDTNMNEMALLFFIAFVTSIMIIFELLKFPPQLVFRFSNGFEKDCDEQYRI